MAETAFQLSGERIQVWYKLTGSQYDANVKAQVICLEQTVEFPAELVPPGFIRDQILGRIESFSEIDDNHFLVQISYAVETSGFELPQLFNLFFGNSSIKPGIRLERFELPDGLVQCFKGPRFGRAGLRERLKVPRRPLLSTALKPMGLSAAQLADYAYRFALGGIDIIKDDHGLANQPFAPFQDRVESCVAAVERANRETGRKSIYVPNITAPVDRIRDQALFAKRAGAGGLMISPGLTGFDTMRWLAEDDEIGLPIISHPAFQGSFVVESSIGISHYALFGQFSRLAGADAVIFPNYGGRFSFSREECGQITTGTTVAMGPLKPIFPAPGGGMSLDRVPDMLEVYGNDVIFLIGGGLHQQGPDLVENCRCFQRMVETIG
jgi:ribulose-bisphosphate carboxylase large chain